MKIFNYTLKIVNTNYKVINSYYGQIDLQPQSCKHLYINNFYLK